MIKKIFLVMVALSLLGVGCKKKPSDLIDDGQETIGVSLKQEQVCKALYKVAEQYSWDRSYSFVCDGDETAYNDYELRFDKEIKTSNDLFYLQAGVINYGSYQSWGEKFDRDCEGAEVFEIKGLKACQKKTFLASENECSACSGGSYWQTGETTRVFFNNESYTYLTVHIENVEKEHMVDNGDDLELNTCCAAEASGGIEIMEKFLESIEDQGINLQEL